MKKNELTKSRKISLIIDIIVISLIIGSIIWLLIANIDKLKLLSTEEGQIWIENSVKKTGVWGVLVLIGFQILQVVIAIIPGEVVEIASGVMFGPFFGTLICLIGLNIATMVIFVLMRFLGKPFLNLYIKDNDKNKFKFLEDPVRALTILFFIFFTPGIPKDIFIFPIPFTKINMWHFMIVSTIARIPSILTSTLVGSAIISKDYKLAFIVTIIMGAFAVIGLIFNKKITLFIEKKIIKKRSE